MNEQQRARRLGRILRDLSDELDVPPSKYREARNHYEAVGGWLGADGSTLAPYRPEVFPQGSFALGTAVRPMRNAEYDVDAVCVLQLTLGQVTQRQLKDLVGDRLKDPGSRYRRMVRPQEGGRRCWTIQYANESQFHIDILPAVPDTYYWLVGQNVPRDWAESAIRITDNRTAEYETGWPVDSVARNNPTRSNPRGYMLWFKARMQTQLEEAKRTLAVQLRADIQKIQDFDVRTPLQRVVQILKRHRDVRYDGDEDKPISIIITTLAAQAYDNQADLAEAVLAVVPKMRNSIENRHGTWWVANPVNPHENFADKWQEKPRKAEVFRQWLQTLERECRLLMEDEGWAGVTRYLEDNFGSRDARAAVARYSAREGTPECAGIDGPIVLTPRRSDRPATPTIELPSTPGKPWRP